MIQAFTRSETLINGFKETNDEFKSCTIYQALNDGSSDLCNFGDFFHVDIIAVGMTGGYPNIKFVSNNPMSYLQLL